MGHSLKRLEDMNLFFTHQQGFIAPCDSCSPPPPPPFTAASNPHAGHPGQRPFLRLTWSLAGNSPFLFLIYSRESPNIIFPAGWLQMAFIWAVLKSKGISCFWPLLYHWDAYVKGWRKLYSCHYYSETPRSLSWSGKEIRAWVMKLCLSVSSWRVNGTAGAS